MLYTNVEEMFLAICVKDDSAWYLSQPRLDWFTQPHTRAVYNAMVVCLEKHGRFSEMGIKHYMARPDLYDQTMRGIDWDFLGVRWGEYRDALFQDWQRRELKKVAEKLTSEIGDRSRTPLEIYDEIITGASAALNETVKDASELYREVLHRLIPILEARINADDLLGLATGIRGLDAMTGGLQKRRLYYIGSRPSQGKSAIAGQIAAYVASNGNPVGFYSVESAAEEIALRMWSRGAGVDNRRLQSGIVNPSELAAINHYAEKTLDIPLSINDRPNATIDEISRQAYIWKRKHGMKLLVVDYVQLIRAHGTKSKQEQVEAVSPALKDLSRDLDIPVLALAQLRRDVDDRRPHLGDFQHSSALEQDADVAILLAWNAQYGPAIPVDAIVAKNRDGEKGVIPLIFRPHLLKFTEGDDIDANYDMEAQGA